MKTEDIRKMSWLSDDEFNDACDLVIKKSIHCHECGEALPNMALIGDYNEGFECPNCGLVYDAYGRKL